MATKKRIAYSYQDAAGNRHSVIVVEAKFGWLVTTIENGTEVRRENATGSMLTVLANALNGHPIG